MAKTVTEARQPDATAGTDAIYRSLFDSFNPDKDGRISPLEVLSRLERSGLQPDDPRIAEALAGLAGADGGSRQISFTQFKALAQHNSSLIRRAVEGNLAVPDFAALTADITRMYDELLPVRSGTVADYIPQLKRVDPDQLAIAVCTVDGQRFSVGDAATAFSLQSVSKTVSYCLALDEHGTEAVHQHVGREPSGRSFNELALNPKGLPHNPMVNAGGIMTCSLIRPDEDIADRFDLVAATWRRLAGGRRPGFNNAVYLSERQTADRNFALGYSMRESGAFRPGTDLTADAGVLLPELLDRGGRADARRRGGVAGQRRGVPADRGPGVHPGHGAELPVADVLLRHVRLLRRVRVHHRAARQERGVRRGDAGGPRADGHLRLVAAAGRARQLGARHRVLPQAGRRVQRARRSTRWSPAAAGPPSATRGGRRTRPRPRPWSR